jgi:hypothetical protein
VVSAHDNNLTNLLRGLVERLYLVSTADGLAPPPRPLGNTFSERLSGFTAQIARYLPEAARVDYDVFVGYYSGRQKAVYQKAVDSLMHTPVQHSDAAVKTFVKAEKTDFSNKPDPAPRIIQPRDPRYNVEVGRFLRPVEKLVYRAIAKVWGGPTVLKANAADQAAALRGMWETFADPVAVGLDASRFDQHVSTAALRWEHGVYLRMFRGEERAKLERLLGWQLNTVGKAYLPTGRVTYRTEGARMSGDINTSLGNCLIMCAMVWAWCSAAGVKARLANNGDDCVVVMERRDLARFMDGLDVWFTEMGFTMAVETPVDTFEAITFCQTSPIWTPEGWVMVRTPDRGVMKDLTSLLNLDTALAAYLGAVGKGGLAATGGIPVYQELYRSMAAAGSNSAIERHAATLGGLRFLAAGMKRQYSAIHPQTRVSFALAFGILPDEQLVLEEWLRDNPLTPALPQTLTTFAGRWYK